jgi:hypothetical protein
VNPAARSTGNGVWRRRIADFRAIGSVDLYQAVFVPNVLIHNFHQDGDAVQSLRWQSLWMAID